MQHSLMAQGLELMLFGMGTVVVFLTLLVLVTTAMSLLVVRFPAPLAETAAQPRPKLSGDAAADPALLAVISAAIHHHRKGR